MEHHYRTISVTKKDVDGYNRRNPGANVGMDTFIATEIDAWSAAGTDYVSGPAIYLDKDGDPVYVFTVDMPTY